MALLIARLCYLARRRPGTVRVSAVGGANSAMRRWTPCALAVVLVLTIVPGGRAAQPKPAPNNPVTPPQKSPDAKVTPKPKPGCSLTTCSWKENKWCYTEPGNETAACVCRPGFAPVGSDCIESITFHLYVLMPGEHMASLNDHNSEHYQETTQEFTNTVSQLHNNGDVKALDANYLAMSSVTYTGGMPRAIIAKALIHYRQSSELTPNRLEQALQNSAALRSVSNLNKDTMEITDENECSTQRGHLSDCHAQATCKNTLGSFECVCKEGFVDMSYAFGAPAGRFCYGKCTTWRCEAGEEVMLVGTLRGDETMCVNPIRRDMCHVTSPIPAWLTDWGDLRLWLVLLGFVIVIVGFIILVYYLCRLYRKNKKKRMEKKRSSHELYSEYWPCHRVRKVSIIGFDIKRRDSMQTKAAAQASKIKMASGTAGRKSITDGGGTMHWNLSSARLPSVSDEDESTLPAENNII
ncbi:Hypp4682 [Branchiostoma lanceolatum]|uniref:Hypp4682 protein n=2 Tax=Branchiostoma lanceolatum TaxID=7740 RepID=A0A8K0AF57_BRALA|nr:Hypp4682 [Branchiostoma lanceolatum]